MTYLPSDHPKFKEEEKKLPEGLKAPVAEPLHPEPEAWRPTAVQKAEVLILGTARTDKPEVVTEEDFTRLWNRCAHMDAAVLELINLHRGMKNELAMALTALKAKQDEIETLQMTINFMTEKFALFQETLGEMDDRINWLET